MYDYNIFPMIKKYALIEDGVVQSVIVWDTDNGDLSSMTSLGFIETDIAKTGDLYIDGQFVTQQNEDISIT